MSTLLQIPPPSRFLYPSTQVADWWVLCVPAYPAISGNVIRGAKGGAIIEGSRVRLSHHLRSARIPEISNPVNSGPGRTARRV